MAERPARRMTIDLRLSSLGWFDVAPATALALAVRHGFESLEPQLPALARLSARERSDLVAKANERGVRYRATGLPVDFRGGQERFEEGFRSLPASADLLRTVGADRMGAHVRPTSDEWEYDRHFAICVDRLRAIARVLADHGVRLGLEYVAPRTARQAGRFPFIHNLASLRTLASAIDLPNIGYVLDSWHWHHADESAADLLALAGDSVVAIDLNDAPLEPLQAEQEDLRRDWPLATGVIRLREFLASLASIGADAPARAEPFHPNLKQMSLEDAVATAARSVRRSLALVDASLDGGA